MFRGKSKRVHAEGHGRGLVELLPWNCCCPDGLLCVCFCPSQETKAPLSSAALFPGITNLSSEEKRWQRAKSMPLRLITLSRYPIIFSVRLLYFVRVRDKRELSDERHRIHGNVCSWVCWVTWSFRAYLLDARWRRELEKLWRSVRFWWDYDEFEVKCRSQWKWRMASVIGSYFSNIEIFCLIFRTSSEYRRKVFSIF